MERFGVKWTVTAIILTALGVVLGAVLAPESPGFWAQAAPYVTVLLAAFLACPSIAVLERMNQGRSLSSAVSSLAESWGWPLEMLACGVAAVVLALFLSVLGCAVLGGLAALSAALLTMAFERNLIWN